jgi:methionyl-tRNA formyltransferase
LSQAALAPGSTLPDPWLAKLSERIWSKPEFSMVPIDVDTVPRGPYDGPALREGGPRIVFCGIPSDYGMAFLLHLIERRANLIAAVCSTRWQRTHPKPDLIARIAGHLGRPVEITADANAEPFVRCLEGYAPDVVVMASFDQILSEQTLAVPRRGWLNIHPSLLPRHRGPEPIYWTIANGDEEAGITVHQTTARIDAGPILAQRRIAVQPQETAGSLARRLVAEGLPALDDVLEAVGTGKAWPVAPPPQPGSYDPPVRQTGLDWQQRFVQIDRLVRAGHSLLQSPGPASVRRGGPVRAAPGGWRSARPDRQPTARRDAGCGGGRGAGGPLAADRAQSRHSAAPQAAISLICPSGPLPGCWTPASPPRYNSIGWDTQLRAL